MMISLKSKHILIIGLSVLCSCKSKIPKNYNKAHDFQEGTFGYDLHFLKQQEDVVVLKNNNNRSEVVVSAKYQGKVFTSTADGDRGKSFGWINYKAFSIPINPHMNAYGGEDRLWLGPEGGQFALFFKKGVKMEFTNWFTPAPIDHESWTIKSKNDKQVSLTKAMSLTNYRGTKLNMRIDRDISLLEQVDIERALNVHLDSTIKAVGFKTDNSITNTGLAAWTTQTGAPCLWNLDMFTPSSTTTIIIPYHDNADGKVATTDYFGQIPADRLFYKKGHLYFKADGKSRGKLGMPAVRSTAMAGSYDAANHVLTITLFDVDSKATYLNQEWKADKDPLIGDAVNAYNDGPLADGTQLGPFYEIESVSPAAFLKPGEKLIHLHYVFHFMGNTASLNTIAVKTLGIELNNIPSVFNQIAH